MRTSTLFTLCVLCIAAYIATIATACDPTAPSLGTPFQDQNQTPQPNDGWIGGPCTSEDSCDYDDAICLPSSNSNDYPDGLCSLPCDRICPDRDGENSVTFCVSDPADTSNGLCVSRCDTDLYPSTGCRSGYTCSIQGRHNQPSTRQAVCLPSSQTPTTPPQNTCQEHLSDADITFSPWPYSPSTPSNTSQTCTVSDPIEIPGTLNGVSFRPRSASSPRPLKLSCPLAVALEQLTEILHDHNITHVIHLGTFNCRTIANTQRLSQHAHGLAIDIWGFVDNTGQTYSLEDHWEHNTTSPRSHKARVLYDIAQRLHNEHIFNTVLTPNYNAGHDNHFHLDLRSGAHFLGHHQAPDAFTLQTNTSNECPGHPDE